MKRRVFSLITTLALFLSLCPMRALAAVAGADDGLCPHHTAHTDECGFAPPSPGAECAHEHDDNCYTITTDCIHEHAAACYSNPDYDPDGDEPDLCAHACTEDGGCVTRTLSCPHEHDGACGYAAEDPGRPCTFVCRICPIDSLIDQLPRSVSAYNIEQVGAQIGEIYDLYDELTAEEQEQVDLSPCLSLLDQMDGMSAAALADNTFQQTIFLNEDKKYAAALVISKKTLINTNGYTLSGPGPSAVQVAAGGELYLKGKVTVDKGVGVEILSGGSLNVTEKETVVTGKTCGLDIASGAKVQLSAGKYTGSTCAIRTANGDFAALLAPGCAYFDDADQPVLPENAGTKTTLSVGLCTDHLRGPYTHDPGATAHTWTCLVCAAPVTENCTFSFAQNVGTCVCGNSLSIAVDESDLVNLVYDGTIKPENINITVTLTDSSNKELEKDTDYRVNYEPRKDVGEITVTVTGITFNGTFIKTYNVTQAKPGITWDEVQKELDYDGRRTTIKDELPHITITLTDPNKEDLHPYLQYSYKEANTGDTEFTDGLPLDVGEYEIKAYIPESQNYAAAETNPRLKLTIKAIDPVTAPEAVTLTYNGAPQELVTAGVVDSRAVGAEILFATDVNGPYSTTIPTGTNAGDYEVWYKVEGTNNYNAVAPTKINDVNIQRKNITPLVTLSQSSYLYDGGEKQPTVTVRDRDDLTVLPDTEYQVEYVNNQNVSTTGNPAKAVVTDKDGGNYEINKAEAEFKITSRTQETLSITSKPNTVTYGDKFTLSTSGGSGNGDVTWEITDGSGVATVDQNSGQVTIIGHGSATVKATKSGTDPATGVVNYEDATASWTFTADKKPVVATVTAEDKTYDGNAVAQVYAIVAQGVLPRDEITITGLTGTFSDENAGVGKTVNVNMSGTAIEGRNHEHYDVSYSSLPVKATINKADLKNVTVSGAANLTYNGTAQGLIAGAAVDPSGISVEYALSEDGPYSTTLPQGTNAGTYTVWYRVAETANYTGLSPKSVDVEISKKPVAPVITLSEDAFTYDGTPKEPTVILKEADGMTVIPDGEYTVMYSDNVNAGTATVTVTAKVGGNYSFTSVSKDFSIKQEQAKVLTAPEARQPLTYNTYAQQLVTAGTASGGTMVYSVDNENGTYSEYIPTKKDAGTYKVYYKVQGDGNHSDSDVDHVDVTISPKTVTNPIIELSKTDGTSLISAPYTYDGDKKEPDVAVKDGSTIIGETEYTAIYSNNTNAGTATVYIVDVSGGNYTVTGSTTFEILKADIVQGDITQPVRATSLEYTGQPLNLVTAGSSDVGILVEYSLDGNAYSANIPTGTNAGTYNVWYRVKGDSNHNDMAGVALGPVTIAQQKVTAPIIEFTPSGAAYDGGEHKPSVTVKDNNGRVIPEEEYSVTYDTATDWIKAGNHNVTITGKAGGNYNITTKTQPFTINQMGQTPLSIVNQPGKIQYGDTFTLSAVGGSGTGAVTWKSSDETVATIDGDGLVKVLRAGGPVTITATKPGDGNYRKTSVSWTFSAEKKPVTPIVTAENKEYNGDAAATLVISWKAGDLLNDNDIDLTNVLSGTFDSSDVGTNKTVTVTAGAASFASDKYTLAITYPIMTTASITPAAATITNAPAPQSLTYTGQPQALLNITGCTVDGGLLAYSRDGVNYTLVVPTETNAGTYSVWYKVLADGNHKDSAAKEEKVTINPKNVASPVIKLSSDTFDYDGTAKEPAVTLTEADGTLIPASEYTVSYSNNTGIGTATVTITDAVGGNYTVSGNKTFTIQAGTASLKDAPQGKGLIYNGYPQELVTPGTATNGHVVYSLTGNGNDYSVSIPTKTDAGTYTVYYMVKGENSASDTTPRVVYVTIQPKPVNPVIQLHLTSDPLPYTGSAQEPTVTVTVDGNLLAEKDYNVSYSSNINPGTATVTVQSLSGNYQFSATKTFEIVKVKAEFTIEPEAKSDLIYIGEAQKLIKENTGTSAHGIVLYSLDGTTYSTAIPTGTNAGDYNVLVKVQGNGTYADSDIKTIRAHIEQATPIIDSTLTATSITSGDKLNQSLFTNNTATVNGVVVPGTFAWTHGDVIPEVGTSDYEVTFTPTDTTNYKIVTVSISVTVNSATGSDTNNSADSSNTNSAPAVNAPSTPNTVSTASAPMRATVQNGTASTVVSDAEGSRLVKEAVESQSQNIVIKPEITGSVTKSEVSIPATTVSQITSETNAALTVSAPIADVTISPAALDTLSRAGGAVSVVTEQAGQSMVLTLTANGENVESVPGGLTLTVPAEDAGPGTVAVLVREDGTRETIRKSVAQDGTVSIPLDGSATVELVDNSKTFTDVPSTSWEADAVAFASAHELFNGTSETTFSPEEPMSRAMLATVLYNLEGSPEQELTSEFSDVSGDAWYADSVSWAAANGITNGSSDSQFGPNDSITREQFAVMLWRYAGSPAASGGDLAFTDADKASDYALEALRWATANGIMNGYGNGQLDPGGTATRAQAAQMLKNFMENT